MQSIIWGKECIHINDEEGLKRKSITTTDLWTQITSRLDGYFEQDKDGNIRQPNTFYFDDFGRQYRNKVIAIIRDKFGAEKDHKEKGNDLVFDLERLEKMNRIYENDGKIKTRAVDESGENEHENDETDSLTHPDHTSRRGCPSESGSQDSKNETDSPSTIYHRHGQSESVNQDMLKKTDSPKVKCPYCDHQDHPFFLKIHRKMAHEGGL